MFTSLILAFLGRRAATFTWSPALDLSDNTIRSTLLPSSLS